jgi:hypothetical protein
MSKEHPLGLDKRRALLSVAVALLLAAGTAGLVGKVADFDMLMSALREADRAWFPVCLAGLVAAYLGYILGYREVARMHGGPRLPLWTVARIVGIGYRENLLGSAPGGLADDICA